MVFLSKLVVKIKLKAKFIKYRSRGSFYDGFFCRKSSGATIYKIEREFRKSEQKKDCVKPFIR